MTASAEPAWMSFDEVSAYLTLPDEDVARLLLAGLLRFEVVKRSPNPDFVMRMDLRIAGDDVRAVQADRWRLDGARADELVNRAAMKFGRHPTRTSPGVRGPAKTKRVIT